MAYSLTVVHEKQMLLLVFDGPHGSAQALAGCREAAAVSQRENIRLILVDICKIDPCLPSTAEIYNVQSSLSDIFSKSCRIAVVYDTSTFLDKNPTFSETICLNRGMQFRIFTSPADAEQWLFSEPCPNQTEPAKL